MRESCCLKTKTIALKSFAFLGLFAIVSLSAVAQKAPGGVTTGLKLWLKADKGTGATTSGDDVTSWLDNSSSPNTITSEPLSTQQPKYVAVGVNYNPSILYVGNAQHKFPGTTGVVPILNSTVFLAGTPLAASSVTDFHDPFASDNEHEFPLNLDGSAAMFGHYSDNPAIQGHYQLPWAYNEFSFVRSQIYPDGSIDLAKQGDGPYNMPVGADPAGSDNYMFIGGEPGENGFGSISEVIVYDNANLAFTDMQKIDAYLGMKYGVELQSENATNFQLSSGTQVWAADANFPHDVLTIVRDDASDLMQKQAHSIADDVKMYTGTLASTNAGNTASIGIDLSSVVIGGNGAPVAMTTELGIPSPVLSRYQKTWAIQNTNFTDNFSIEIKWDSAKYFDMTAFRLLISGDSSDFSVANAYSPTFTSTLNSIIISGIDATMIPSGAVMYFSIGSTTLSTLPVSMTFTAAVTPDSKVALNWQTTSEINNNYFTVERSVDAQSWEAVTKVNGAINSSTVQNYSFVDKTPYTGVSYYRIKQTDLDGKYSYSKVKIVKVDKNRSGILTMYPNPVAGSLYIRGAATELSTIRIFNMTGVDVTTLVKIIETTSAGKVLDVSRLSAGNYNIKTATAVTKLIKL